MARQGSPSGHVVFATLRVRGPKVSVIVQGHPPLVHDGQGETVWTVALPADDYNDALHFLRGAGVEVQAHEMVKASHPHGKYDACQFCAFFDPLSATQCGFTDWDDASRGHTVGLPDGQSSLDRCPDLHSGR